MEEQAENRAMDYIQFRNVIILIKWLLIKQHISQVVLAERLRIPTTRLSDQLFLRTQPDEALLQRVVNGLNLNLDVKDKTQLLSYLEQEKIEYSEFFESSKKNSKVISKSSPFNSFQWQSSSSKEVGNRIQKVRLSLGLSKDIFAAQIDLKLPVYVLTTWEKGTYLPNLTHCIKISQLGGVSLDWLFMGREAKEGFANSE